MYALPKIGFCQANCNAIKNYANFSGRIRRSEYWYFVSVVNTLTIVFLSLFIFFICGGGRKRYSERYYYNSSNYYYRSYYRYNDEGIIASMVLLCFHVGFIMIPLFAATVRRLHDTGRRGEYIFLGLVPFFGQITLLVILCKDSSQGNNEYGNSPKYSTMDMNSPMVLYNQNNVTYNPNLMNVNPNNINSNPNNMNSNPNNTNLNINSNNSQPPSNYYAPVN